MILNNYYFFRAHYSRIVNIIQIQYFINNLYILINKLYKFGDHTMTNS
jgi:hypothetical protein